jgi:hypothetical protein
VGAGRGSGEAQTTVRIGLSRLTAESRGALRPDSPSLPPTPPPPPPGPAPGVIFIVLVPPEGKGRILRCALASGLPRKQDVGALCLLVPLVPSRWVGVAGWLDGWVMGK